MALKTHMQIDIGFPHALAPHFLPHLFTGEMKPKINILLLSWLIGFFAN